MASHLDETFEELVVGVSITSEAASSSVDVAGIVKVKPQALNLSQLRDLMRRELPSLPPFRFLTKQGWPITEQQESEIKMTDLVNENSLVVIRRSFSQPRIGVRNLSREIMGFIFIDYSKSVADLRQALKEQLIHVNSDVLFLDRNCWPVCLNQEKEMLLWDLVADNFITIRSSIADNVSYHTLQHSIDGTDGHTLKRKSSDWNLTLEGRPMSEKDETKMPVILISYVRAEASKHARDLKWQLADKGYKVFLDVDEIHGGVDWQDALNNAVQNCNVFIPLITPQYGLTIWTNREVKLADQQSKLIIPINFLNHWPPECLAIQFASLHFVPWKTPAELEQEEKDGLDSNRSHDIHYWDTVYIKRVVENISLCHQEHLSQETQLFVEELEDEFHSLGSKETKANQLTPTAHISDIEFDRAPPKLLIVLSVHPNDKEYTNNIRSVLSDCGYDVWSSSDLMDDMEGLHTQPASLSCLTSPTTPLPPSFSEQGPILVNNCSQESTCSEAFYHTAPKRPSLHFSYSINNARTSLFNRSDSQLTLSPIAMDKLRVFRNQAKKACIVIVLLSEDYCKARTSQKQVYYCEHRKWVIPIKLSSFRCPNYITCLFGHNILEYQETPEFFEELRFSVKKGIGSKNSPPSRSCVSEVRLQSKIAKLKESISQNFCIYVTGSTRLHNPRTESICNAIGEELGACNFISLATGGFYGVGEIVGRSFCEVRDMSRQRPADLFNILPHQDCKDLSKVSSQLADGKFAKLPYGQTLFVGDSVCERDSVVARTFDVFLLIEGGADAAQEAEHFVWNDKIVIPVISTGGAAAGEFSAPTKIMDVPPGVSEGDWMLLAKRDEPVEVIAAAIKRILCSLKTKEAKAAETAKKSRGKRSSKKVNKNSH